MLPIQRFRRTLDSLYVTGKGANYRPIRRVFRRHRASDRPLNNNNSNSAEVNSAVGTPTGAPEPAPFLSPKLGPLTKFLRWYGKVHTRRPLFTQFCTSITIYTLGDLCAQNIGTKEYEAQRTGRAIIIGGISSIPVYKWVTWLGNSFNFSSKALSLFTKVMVNQIFFTPTFNTYFFGMQSLLSGDSLAEAWERVKETVPRSAIASFKFWPFVTAFHLTFLQPMYRSMFIGVVSIGWQTYLSLLNRWAEEEEIKNGLRPAS